jgi:hypothetical protein
MTEWELQDQLTLQWIDKPLLFNGVEYFVVAWELMFPSWQINENSKKWNEKSVDFIMFDGISTFLCLELKNEIKGRQALLSAYCQAMHRTRLFKSQYRPSLMKNAHNACFDRNNSYRIQQIDEIKRDFNFPAKADFQCVLAAAKFPANAAESFQEWRRMTKEQLFYMMDKYKRNKANQEIWKYAEMEWRMDHCSILPIT